MDVDNMKGHPDMAYAEHARSYKTFVRAFTWGTAICLFIVAMMGWQLV